MRFLTSSFALTFLGQASAFAAEGEHHALPMNAQRLAEGSSTFSFLTNSTIMVWIAVIALVVICQLATRNVTLIPSKMQGLVEWAVDSMYQFLEGVLGAHLTKRTFWFFGSVFFFILCSNWLGLIPGVGTIGHYDSHHNLIPWLRGANADLNMTSAMALTFALLWVYWAVTENGLGGFLAHIFAPKGKFSGIMAVFMMAVFFLVGVLEVVSICIRPVALSLRLFGNIYGGEMTLESLFALVPDKLWMLKPLPALPLYFMELLVGLVQALVFTLLCAVFLKLICEHADHDHEEGADHH